MLPLCQRLYPRDLLGSQMFQTLSQAQSSASHVRFKFCLPAPTALTFQAPAKLKRPEYPMLLKISVHTLFSLSGKTLLCFPHLANSY